MVNSPVEIDRILEDQPANDQAVIETLVREYHAYLYHLTASLLNDPDEAADAVQETFIAATLNLAQYQAGTNFKAWLYTIAVNICRRRLNKRSRRQRLSTALKALQVAAPRTPTPEEAALQTESDDALWKAVHQLDEKHRLPILLRYLHHLPIREIAQILEVNPGTIHSRLYYACRKLEKQLKNSPVLEKDSRKVSL